MIIIIFYNSVCTESESEIKYFSRSFRTWHAEHVLPDEIALKYFQKTTRLKWVLNLRARAEIAGDTESSRWSFRRRCPVTDATLSDENNRFPTRFVAFAFVAFSPSTREIGDGRKICREKKIPRTTCGMHTGLESRCRTERAGDKQTSYRAAASTIVPCHDVNYGLSPSENGKPNTAGNRVNNPSTRANWVTRSVHVTCHGYTTKTITCARERMGNFNRKRFIFIYFFSNYLCYRFLSSKSVRFDRYDNHKRARTSYPRIG